MAITMTPDARFTSIRQTAFGRKRPKLGLLHYLRGGSSSTDRATALTPRSRYERSRC